MNIAFFTESYKPYISGVTISIENLATQLEKLGHNVFIFCPSYPGHSEAGPKVFRFPSIGIPSYPGFRVAIPYSRKISKIIPELNLNIIHSHDPFNLGRFAIKFSKKLEIPYVYTFHTLFTEYLHYIPLVPKNISKPIMNALIRRFCNKCDTIIAPSRYVKNTLVLNKIKPAIEVVPSGVNFNLINSAKNDGIRQKYNIGDNKKILIFVGRLSKEKNIPFLFESFKIIKGYYPNVVLLIVARGPEHNKLEKLAKNLDIGKDVFFAGQIKQPEIFKYYKTADVFVFASKTETQGLVIAEAKAAGLPAVALDAAGVSDTIKDNEDGFLVPESAATFARKVLSLLTNENLRKEMSIKAAENAKKEFSSEAYGKKAESIYYKLTG